MKYKLQLIELQRALTLRAEAEGREMTAEEQQEFDILQRMLDRCTTEDGEEGAEGSDDGAGDRKSVV